ncbi:hypothetical protein Micbo1qcDRAFT_155707 [Microdochium bolleyi]|uniref:ER membrane protein complex subunit 7 beta-sandwich domain-containing protein n=1 Tax=Microdochium bolleyi TaxID=196109 RepID=A0A136JIJ4_9PEZI|nr:hypothetical protein Micbo1qcDRAFT_155707 [Microdochium bolleyi]
MRTTTFWSAASSLLAVLATSATAAAAATTATTSLRIAIPASQHLQNPSSLPPSTHATLTTLGRAVLSAPLNAANQFVFDNVTAGSYLADIHCPLFGFAPLRVDVGPFEDALKVQVWETYRGNDWENKGEEIPARKVGAGSLRGGVYEARLVGRKVYFQERASFSIMSILKNPMILMGIVSLAMFIGVPKLIESMDPETRAEFEAQRRENPVATLMSGGTPGGGGAAASGPNFDVAGFLSGHSANKGGARTPSPAPPADVVGDAAPVSSSSAGEAGAGKNGKKRK